MSGVLEQPRDWATVFERYGGTESFDTYEAVARGAGRSSRAVTGLATFGEYAGPIGLTIGFGVAGYEVYQAPEPERPRVAFREASGMGGGIVGMELGTAGGVALAGGIAIVCGLSGPPGWLVLVLGIGGGIGGGVAGTEIGRATADYVYEEAESSWIELNRSLEQRFLTSITLGTGFF